MPNLGDQLKRFVNTSRGKGRLDAAPERDAIAIAVSTGLPTTESDPQTGAGAFVELDDTPEDYTGAADQTVVVNATGDALEFFDGVPIKSPLTEQSRTTTTVRICCDSDPNLFVDFEVSTQIVFNDANGTQIVLDLTPDTTSNCP